MCICGNDRVAGQEEFAKFRVVVQISATFGVIQIEERPAWQRLAPQEFVVLPKGGAVCVRVLSKRVRPEVKRGVDNHELAVYRRREAIQRSFAIGSGATRDG